LTRNTLAIYHPARRGLAMTFAYTRPLPRVMGSLRTSRFGTQDRLMATPLRPLVRLLQQVKSLFSR